MGMFDIFTNSQPTNVAPPQGVPGVPGAPAPAQVQPGNIPAPADPAAPGQGVVPASAANAAAVPREPESPLDTFKDLWEPVPIDPANPVPAAPQPLTAEQVQAAVAKANFAGAVTPDQMAAINQGGEAAQVAMAAMMNSVAQQVMVQATMVNNKLTEKAVATALEAQKAEIPGMLRKQASTSHLNDTSALFSNPAIKPVVEATQAQLLQKFPNATPAEITTMTQDYIQAMGEQFAPPPPSNPNEQDWSTFA